MNTGKIRFLKTITSFFIFVPVTILAQSFQLQFEQANRLYSDARYEEAISVYQRILAENVVSGEIYFNLGNTYFKLDQLGKALLYYEKAQRYLEGDEALLKNLQIARLQVVDQIEPLPQLFFEEWWKAAIQIFSVSSLSWASLILFFILSLIIGINLIYNRRYFFKIIWVIAICFLVVLILFLGRIYDLESSTFGIIQAKKVSVLSEPNPDGNELFILHEGTKVRINRELQEWLEISLVDGKTGWLQSDILETI